MMAAERAVPSLVSLCIGELKNELIRGDDCLSAVYELPPELFDTLVARLPPWALQKLHLSRPFEEQSEIGPSDDRFRSKKQRVRNWNLDAEWRVLFKLRWPDHANHIHPIDWHQVYWETHLQNCLDEAAAMALVPSFDGSIGQIQIPDDIVASIGCEGQKNQPNNEYLKLSYHCQEFGSYARCLRIQNVLCTAEISDLLKQSKLQSLFVRCIRSKEHIEGLCKLLSQQNRTLTSLEFVHCKLSLDFIDTICGSLVIKSIQKHRVQHFSINTCSISELNSVSVPYGLVSFLSSGRPNFFEEDVLFIRKMAAVHKGIGARTRRSIQSLKFSDNRLGRNFAKMIFMVLLNVSSSVSILDLSENNIGGWLSDFNERSSRSHLEFIGSGKSLQFLRVLILRGSNLLKNDAESLRYALFCTPNLEVLDISDNYIEDEGIRCLIPYFIEASETLSPLAELSLENCELSCDGVTQLLDVLSTLKSPLKSLSIADNFLGSQVAVALGKCMGTSIQELNVGGISLGSAGFQELQNLIVEEIKLVKINISKNRGGIETAKFVARLFSLAPELTTVNAAYNLMPRESLNIIYSALQVAKGKLQHLNLTGHVWESNTDYATMFTEFVHNGKPVLILPSLSSFAAPYDDDP